MSFASVVFNRNLWKLLLALAIPTGIVYFFWYSQQQANIEVEKYKQEQKDRHNAEGVEIDNYQMKEVDGSNRVRWQLTADAGQMMPDGKNVGLKGVNVEYFDPQTRELKMRISAPNGLANQETKFVQLKGEGGKQIVAVGGGFRPSKFTCQQLELKNNNRFSATGGVIIDWPGVAKVSGNSATGSTNLAAGPKDFKVVGNTHAEIAVH